MVTEKNNGQEGRSPGNEAIDPDINPMNKLISQQQQVKTPAQECFEEMQPVLGKFNCQIICVPQVMYGQTVYVPMVEQIKK